MNIDLRLSNMIVAYLCNIESDAAQFPEENSVEIQVSDLMEHLLNDEPNDLMPSVEGLIERFVATAPRHVFVPHWLKTKATP